jgi:RNA polymerase sigma factor (TIGR02999 family)
MLEIAMSDVTRILRQIESGDRGASEQLLPLVYDELRKLASARMAHESPDHTLQATALVHEAYIRLVVGEEPQQWNSRGHFFGAAAEAMRRILVEDARRKARLRHGGGRRQVGLSQITLAAGGDTHNILDLDAALTRLQQEEPAAAEVVQLRYFTGLTIQQAAAALDISVRTANRHWAYAKAWLYQELQGETTD